MGRHARLSESLIRAVVGSCEFALSVLGAILLYHGPRGAWPSVGTLCHVTGKSEAAIHRALRALVQSGILLSARRRRPNGSDTTTVYRLAARFEVGASEGGCQSWEGGGVVGDTPLDLPNTQGEQPLKAPSAEADAGTGTGGGSPPLPPTLSTGAIVGEVLERHGRAYRKRHGRAYLGRRRDASAVRVLVAWAAADGAGSAPEAIAWVGSYLRAFWRLSGPPRDRGYRLSDALKVPEFCRPKAAAPGALAGASAAIPPPTTPHDQYVSNLRSVLGGLASEGLTFARELGQRIALREALG